MTLIELNNVSKSFNKKVLFENISLKIKESTINTITGSSGSGKTTLLMMAGASLSAKSGDIYIMGNKINSLKEKKLKEYRKSHIGFIFQHFNLFDTLNAYENISIGSDIFNKKEILKIMDDLNILHLKNSKVKYLSGGEKQRVAIARAIIKKPKIIIADEPTGNLDKDNTKNIMNIFRGLCDDYKISCLIATHDSFVADYSDFNVGI